MGWVKGELSFAHMQRHIGCSDNMVLSGKTYFNLVQLEFRVILVNSHFRKVAAGIVENEREVWHRGKQ